MLVFFFQGVIEEEDTKSPTGVRFDQPHPPSTGGSTVTSLPKPVASGKTSILN